MEMEETVKSELAQLRKDMHCYRRRAIVGFLVLIAGLGAGRVLDVRSLNDQREAVVRSGNAVIVASCNRDFKTGLKQRRALVKNPRFNPAQMALSRDEKNKLIRSLTPLPDCTKVEGLLTDNPDRRISVPKALSERDLTNNGLPTGEKKSRLE